MIRQNIDLIIECMATTEGATDIQRIQTAHRLKLAEFWGIQPGEKVLEIGCGQGDTTAVLAYLVGEEGLVHGVDIGPETYGSPVTLGEAADHLRQSALGKQIRIEFDKDLLDSAVDFPEQSFDCIVLSHSSWYLSSADELKALLTKVKKWGKRLCFAEWDTRLTSLEQYPHLLAVLIQAQYEAFKESSESNVRTLLTPPEIEEMAIQSGWRLLKDTVISSPELQDGSWEAGAVFYGLDTELQTLSLPPKLKQLIRSEAVMLKNFTETHQVKPLSVYALVAE